MKIKQLVGISLSILITSLAQAQQVGPSTFNSSGGGSIINGNSYDYSIGEMTIVSTGTAGSNDYTQGVLQPNYLKTDAINQVSLSQQLLNVFPNPTSSQLNIQLKQSDIKVTAITLTDMFGKIVYENKNNLTGNLLKLDMQQFASATYTLIVATNKSTNPFVFKISKSNQ